MHMCTSQPLSAGRTHLVGHLLDVGLGAVDDLRLDPVPAEEPSGREALGQRCGDNDVLEIGVLAPEK